MILETTNAAMAHAIAMTLRPSPVFAPAMGKVISAVVDPWNLMFGMVGGLR